MGNTCYLNSILQIIRTIPSINNIKNLVFYPEYRPKKKMEKSYFVVKTLNEILHNIEMQVGINKWKGKLTLLVELIFPNGTKNQQDAHEFLFFLSDNIQNFSNEYLNEPDIFLSDVKLTIRNQTNYIDRTNFKMGNFFFNFYFLFFIFTFFFFVFFFNFFF
jgi:uncharacterized UBP type Zn finger protein